VRVRLLFVREREREGERERGRGGDFSKTLGFFPGLFQTWKYPFEIPELFQVFHERTNLSITFSPAPKAGDVSVRLLFVLLPSWLCFREREREVDVMGELGWLRFLLVGCYSFIFLIFL